MSTRSQEARAEAWCWEVAHKATAARTRSLQRKWEIQNQMKKTLKITLFRTLTYRVSPKVCTHLESLWRQCRLKHIYSCQLLRCVCILGDSLCFQKRRNYETKGKLQRGLSSRAGKGPEEGLPQSRKPDYGGGPSHSGPRLLPQAKESEGEGHFQTKAHWVPCGPHCSRCWSPTSSRREQARGERWVQEILIKHISECN